MKRLLPAALLLVSLSTAGRSAPGTLDEYRTIYESSVHRTAEQAKTAEQAALKRYEERLEHVINSCKRSGDLAGYSKTSKELERLTTQQTVPDKVPDGSPELLAKAHSLYLAEMQQVSRTSKVATLKLISQYLPRLEDLKRRLMVGDKIQSATAVEQEIKRIDFVKADIESKLQKLAKVATKKSKKQPTPHNASKRPSGRQQTSPRTKPDAWSRRIAAMPLDERIESVKAELKRLNPEAPIGGLKYQTRDGQVVQIRCSGQNMNDISPLRALQALEDLNLYIAAGHEGQLSLKGLEHLSKLTRLEVYNCRVYDFSPLRGSNITQLKAQACRVKDYSPLADMPHLKRLWCDMKPSAETVGILRKMKSLELFNGKPIAAVLERWQQEISD